MERRKISNNHLGYSQDVISPSTGLMWQHYREPGISGYPLKGIRKESEKAGFKIKKTCVRFFTTES